MAWCTARYARVSPHSCSILFKVKRNLGKNLQWPSSSQQLNNHSDNLNLGRERAQTTVCRTSDLSPSARSRSMMETAGFFVVVDDLLTGFTSSEAGERHRSKAKIVLAEELCDDGDCIAHDRSVYFFPSFDDNEKLCDLDSS